MGRLDATNGPSGPAIQAYARQWLSRMTNGKSEETPVSKKSTAPTPPRDAGQDAIVWIEDDIPLDDLTVSPHNPRRRHDPKHAQELASQIAAVGLLHPGTARPLEGKPGQFELLAGSRRYQAHKTLGLATMRCRHAMLTDAQALEIITIENLGREDLTPFEEADGVQHLLGAGWEAKAIGDRLGKSEAWVRRRVKLLSLSKAWQKAVLDADTMLSVWPAVLLERVAALPPAVQDAALKQLEEDTQNEELPWWSWDNHRPLPTETELARWLANEYLHTLAAAPFDLTDESLCPKAGACTACPKRSSVEPLLWADAEDSKKKAAADRCLDKPCYTAKVAAHAKRLLEQNPDAKPVMIAADYDEAERVEKAFKGEVKTYHSHEKPAAAKANEKGAQAVVVVGGEGAGTLRWIKPGKTESPASRGNGAGVKKKGVPAATVRARRRMSFIIKAVRDRVTKMAEDTALKLPDRLLVPETAMRLAACFGTHERFSDALWQTWRRPSDPWKSFAGKPPKNASDHLVREVLPVLAQRCYFISGETAEKSYPEARRVAALLDIDIVAIGEEALAEIPEPAAAKARAGKRGAKSKAVRGKRKSAAQIVEEAAAFEENTGDENDDDPSGQYQPGYRDAAMPVKVKRGRAKKAK